MDYDITNAHSYVVRTRTGYDARCYVVCATDLNRIGRCVEESSHRTFNAAVKAAKAFHKRWGGTINPDFRA